MGEPETITTICPLCGQERTKFTNKARTMCKACYSRQLRNDPVKGPERRRKLREYVKAYKHKHPDKVYEWHQRTRERTEFTIVEIDE